MMDDATQRMLNPERPTETLAAKAARLEGQHACPPGSLYVCPTAREVESSCHGGFATCCDRPDLHVPIPDGPGAEALSTALSEAAKREHLLQQGAVERSALLEECRDLLESAGHNGAHGDDWPEVAPALRKLIAERDRAQRRVQVLEREAREGDEEYQAQKAELQGLRGVQGANNRAWDVVKLWRLESLERGEGQFSDPKAQALSSALVGTEHHQATVDALKEYERPNGPKA